MEIHDKALAAGLEVHLITDSGKTEFHGEPTNTCLAIGPDEADKIDFEKTARVYEFVLSLAGEIDKDGMAGREPLDDTVAFEIRTLERAAGELLPLLLGAVGIPRFERREHLDPLVGVLRQFLMV